MKSLLQIASPIVLCASIALTGCSSEHDAGAAKAATQATSAPSSIRDISVAEANEMLAGDNGAVVLDVRTPAEFDAGRIDGAINADFLAGDFVTAIADLDRDTAYILHCKSGSRSARALEILKEQGFTNVAHLTAGYDGWKAAQDPQ
ncbi:hypothetical protein EH31_08385 [Erythrobacter longus]|uniref:Rhodanese domain-containing protein n=1 Tax=Erythrobacter longus TaxID=1044 RepID=A0A074MBJ3_ERYLO|nr:rhodanese-like domain-containing protein [Erythrobacter longus]KEO90100.1 hypothetical protein EH31_08385 [Erythrobacter longus]